MRTSDCAPCVRLLGSRYRGSAPRRSPGSRSLPSVRLFTVRGRESWTDGPDGRRSFGTAARHGPCGAHLPGVRKSYPGRRSDADGHDARLPVRRPSPARPDPAHVSGARAWRSSGTGGRSRRRFPPLPSVPRGRSGPTLSLGRREMGSGTSWTRARGTSPVLRGSDAQSLGADEPLASARFTAFIPSTSSLVAPMPASARHRRPRPSGSSGSITTPHVGQTVRGLSFMVLHSPPRRLPCTSHAH
jgi:hypothetical protein